MENERKHWKQYMLRDTPSRGDIESIFGGSEEIVPMIEQRKWYVEYLNNFEYNINNVIDRSNPEEVAWIEDWDYGEWCKGEIQAIDRVLEQQKLESDFASGTTAISSPKYPGIADALNEYVRGASDNDLENIIISKTLPAGAERKEWIGRPADAHRFLEKIGMKTAQWNKCFRLPSKKPLTDNMRSNAKWKIEDGKCEILTILAAFGL